MLKTVLRQIPILLLMLMSLGMGAMLMQMGAAPLPAQAETATVESGSSPQPEETLPPYTPLPSLTPAQTLKPPPTFEPPTVTPAPSLTPVASATTALEVNVAIPGLHGAESPTPSTTPGCKVRDDWQLTYVVQANDTLTSIAALYGTTIWELAPANCLTDANVIVVGQKLRVPGAAQPLQLAVECTPWEVLTPINGAYTIAGDGPLTFNWRGPRAPINLLRIVRPDGTIYERTLELRQNEIIEDIGEHLPRAGVYTWYVYPLGRDFRQINCVEGGPWTFNKAEAPPTPTPGPALNGGAGSP